MNWKSQQKVCIQFYFHREQREPATTSERAPPKRPTGREQNLGEKQGMPNLFSTIFPRG